MTMPLSPDTASVVIADLTYHESFASLDIRSPDLFLSKKALSWERMDANSRLRILATMRFPATFSMRERAYTPRPAMPVSPNKPSETVMGWN